MYYKRTTEAGIEIGFFGGTPSQEWSLASDNEVQQFKIIPEAKQAKIKEIKAKRDILLNQSYSLEINGETLQFNLHYSNLPILEGKLKRLNNDVDTDTFTTIDNKEIHLNRVFFNNYIAEIENNDRNAFGLAAAKITELNALTTLIAVKNFNTDLI